MIRLWLLLAVGQLAVNYGACARRAPSTARAAGSAAQVATSSQRTPSDRAAHHAAWQAQQNATRQRFAALVAAGPVQAVTSIQPAPPSKASAAPETAQVTVDLRPPEMRRGGAQGPLDPTPLTIKIDGLRSGVSKAGAVVRFDLSPGAHTIAITDEQGAIIATRVVDAVLGTPTTVVFTE